MTTPWHIKGPQFVTCNCDYGCPCQFNALPTHGHCNAFSAGEIESGKHGDVALDGLRWACVLKWPGPIHEGNGEAQMIVDSRASEAQREALLQILAGEDTEPGATHFNVFASTMATVHPPAFADIEFDCDVDKRTARVKIDGYIDARGEPIRNPVTGAEHRAQIAMPEGFEYTVAEIASGSGKTAGAIPLSFDKTHAHLVNLDMTGQGVVR